MSFEFDGNSRRWRNVGRGLLLVGLGLAGCDSPPPLDSGAELEGIREASRGFSQAERSRNPDSILTFFWEDAVMQPPRRAQLNGREAIRAFYAAEAARPRPSGPRPPQPERSTPAPDAVRPPLQRGIEISAAGDLAVEWGQGSGMRQGADGPVPFYYKFVTVWERRGGEWKVLLNSWNPRPGPQPAGADTVGDLGAASEAQADIQVRGGS